MHGEPFNSVYSISLGTEDILVAHTKRSVQYRHLDCPHLQYSAKHVQMSGGWSRGKMCLIDMVFGALKHGVAYSQNIQEIFTCIFSAISPRIMFKVGLLVLDAKCETDKTYTLGQVNLIIFQSVIRKIPHMPSDIQNN